MSYKFECPVTQEQESHLLVAGGKGEARWWCEKAYKYSIAQRLEENFSYRKANKCPINKRKNGCNFLYDGELE
ncbi:unnamed protein product [marine sediment metagenome]|uniref:Uncharacterized protein n=1 Tax=marine sediment metagenome TaxID=412755 RepID=X1EZN3_9ZZZZ